MKVTDAMVDKLEQCLEDAEMENPWMDPAPILRRVLEAVLADVPEPTPVDVASLDFDQLQADGERLRQQVRERLEGNMGLPAWVEQLAATWERAADELPTSEAGERAWLRRCAEELRERAKAAR